MKKIFILMMLCIGHSLGAYTFLVFGGRTGWIGQTLVQILKQQGHTVYSADSRLENRQDIAKEITLRKPDYAINAAGVTGVPNVDWCEDNKQETIRANIIGALNLADVCYEQGIHMTNIGTGCIYEYDDEHPMYGGKGFVEEDKPNFNGSFYSHTKCMLDDLLSNYPNVLNLRLRMPISDDLHPRNFITKITKYAKVVNVPNSMSVLPELLPLIPIMAQRKLTGNFNFVNPGVISHNEVLDLYTKYVDPSFTYKNFTIEEQNKILKARRSNNHLSANKLLKEFPDLLSIQDAVTKVVKMMSKKLKYDYSRK